MARIITAFLFAILGVVLSTPGIAQVDAGSSAANGSDGSARYVYIVLPNQGRIGEPFDVDISLKPASEKPVTVHMVPGGIKYSQTRFTLSPGEHKFIKATATDIRDGIVWVAAYADGGYEGGSNSINMGFLAHLEVTTAAKLPYNTPTTLTLSLFDKDHKPFSPYDPMILSLESSDATLSAPGQTGIIKLNIPDGATVSPQFQLTPKNLQGGTIHLNATLGLQDYEMSLDSESFTLSTEPAVWLPIVLAICGGLLYGVYRILNSNSFPAPHQIFASIAVLVSCGLAGFVGYLIADFDLLGLKLDPNVLRSYPLLGFLVAYLGLDTFLKGKMPEVRASGESATEGGPKSPSEKT